MTATTGSDDRVVLPRWRSWKENQSTGEFQPLRAVTNIDADETAAAVQAEISQRISEFRATRGLYEAADLVSAVISLGSDDNPEIQQAAYLLIDSSLPLAAEAARRILAIQPPEPGASEPHVAQVVGKLPSREDLRLHISQLRQLLRRQPRSALEWADLALAQTTLGNMKAAGKAIRVATTLAPSNRFVLRAAARYFVQDHDLDAARAVLESDTSRLEQDPWLLAADIAICDMAGEPIRHRRRAKRLLESDLSSRHLSELAAAMGTLEFETGRTREARRLFASALDDPTDNSAAQAEWALGRGLLASFPSNVQPPLNFEATARNARRGGDFNAAALQSRLWQDDQPFDVEPAQFASYVLSSFTEDYNAAVVACKIGLRANPGDQILLNNLAFAQANLGQIDSASDNMAHLTTSDDPRKLALWDATRGLIAFRRGQLEEGRRSYRASVEAWKNVGDDSSRIKAAIFWAREELRADTIHAESALRLVNGLYSATADDPENRLMWGNLMKRAR